MKRAVLLFLSVAFCATVVYAADPAEGYWLVKDNTGKAQSGWEIYQRDGVLYGKILSSENSTAETVAVKCNESYKNFPVEGVVNKMPVLGTPWIFGLRKESAGRWTNGSVINPDSGSIYRCDITYHTPDGKKFFEETLELTGKLLVFSGSQYFVRATFEVASSIR
jgi:uncharacterized protein (DUF2147 family)